MAMLALRPYRACIPCLIALAVMFLVQDMTEVYKHNGNDSDASYTYTTDKQNNSTTTTDNPYWWEPYVDQVARPFPILNDTEKSWCVPRQIPEITSLEEPTVKSGLYLVKVTKTASSTSAGVTIQIARNAAERQQQQQHQQQRNASQSMECTYHTAHGFEYVHRQAPHFMWTVVRDPSKRAISYYNFFVVSRKKKHHGPDKMIRKIQEYKSVQLLSVSHQFYKTRESAITAEDVVDILRDDVFGSYGFVESLVALKFILGVELHDIVVLSSKRNGGFDDGRYQNTCFRIQPADTPPKVEAFLQEGFLRDNHDYFLYAVANRSLDFTIDAIGRERFERDLETFRKMSKYAEAQCLDKAVFPCVAEGQPPLTKATESCYFGDIGCGHECVQDALRIFDI
ncbi:MAG: hypothetical protein SGARI_004529 [Bacillariaceae sp.]